MAWRLRLRQPFLRELLIAGTFALGTLVLTYAGVHVLGSKGVLVPFALVVLVIMVFRPFAMVALTTAAVILAEGPSFGLFSFTSHLYGHVYRQLTPVDMLVAVTVVAVGLDIMRTHRQIHMPRSLAFALALLGLGMLAGAITGHAAGNGLRSVLFGENVLAYVLLLPVAVANLDIGPERVRALLLGAVGLAVVKAGLGLVEIFGHKGAPIEGATTLTYYEPTANWLMMLTLLGLLAVPLLKIRGQRWMAPVALLLLASLLLSYRRSFWVAAVLCVLLVVILGSSPQSRRLLVPVGLLLAVSIWLLGSVHFQSYQSSQSPIVRRVASLQPSSLDQNVEDRYRLDERANVIGTLREHPFTGLGVLVPWAPTFQPLSVEHPEAREYVHFGFLWFWLKMGIIGALAYLGLLGASALTAWKVWHLRSEPLFKLFGLASLCGFAGLLVIETTATFTGVDPRFSVLLGVQIGLLALLAQTASPASADAPSP